MHGATGVGAAAGPEPRVAFLNDNAANQQLIVSKKYARNVIVTSKYTTLSFVPKTIFEFFRVVANVYFLLISLLQLATPWSPTNRFTTAGPLVFVLFVTMAKQGTEDLKRHQADEKQNHRACRIISTSGETELVAWQDLQVGQLVCVENNEELPADVVLLATSEEEGRCFIETSNLDGETNLKRRLAVRATAQLAGWRALNDGPLSQDAVCASATRRLRGRVEHEQPNNQLYTFTGRMLLSHGDRGETATPLGPENLLLRGCSLRSCAFVVGLVIFTGSETKLLQNSRAAPSKQSKLYRTANRCMLLIFVTMFALCLVSAVAAAVWTSRSAGRIWYLPFATSADGAAEFVVNFFTFLILYNNLVPISLYVSLDIIKVLQANRLTADEDMMHEGVRALARTSELNEELGQVEYVFSDKTGTLTCNVMEFRKCAIGGISYGFGTTEIGRAVAALASAKSRDTKSGTSARSGDASGVRLDMESTDDIKGATNLPPLRVAAPMDGGDPRDAQVNFDPSIHFDDPALLRTLYAGGAQSERIHEFLTLLAICHTVIPEQDARTGTTTYRASSPDEEALVKAAKCLGYNFVAPAPLVKVEISRKAALLPVGSTLNAPTGSGTETKTYTIVNVNEFNSTRKRMSVVAVNEATREYVLYCKGADNMMLDRTAASDSGSGGDEAEAKAKLLAHLQGYAREGLRTLVLGRRVLSAAEYDEYNAAYVEASTSLKDREAKLDACAEMVERELTLLGVTAIEDKLQAGVPSAIADLAQAGIKVWVLTGDREETAINIGHACRLIDDKMQLLYVNAESVDALAAQLKELHEAPELQRFMGNRQVADNLAMVCDGKALVHVFPSRDAKAKMTPEATQRAQELADKLLAVASVCKALIACRVSPSQKAEIVQLVRKGGGAGAVEPITLAIGDGANDVSMIQTAHVGVGISGKEGVQAVNASDYAVAQFRFLSRLLLLHGRSNYKRVCKVIRYSFYKNIALVISLFLFNFLNAQSGVPLFESFVMAGWNFFLALPIIVIGVFDQDLSEHAVRSFPQLYRRGQLDSDLNLRVFARTIAAAVSHALVCFLGCYLATSRGATQGLFVLGTLFYSALLAAMNLQVGLLALSWNKYHVGFLLFSAWLYLFFLLVYPHFTFLSFDMLGVPAQMVREQRFWTLLLLCPVAALLPNFAFSCATQQLSPTAETILRERERFPVAAGPENEIVLVDSGLSDKHSHSSHGSQEGANVLLPRHQDKVFVTDAPFDASPTATVAGKRGSSTLTRQSSAVGPALSNSTSQRRTSSTGNLYESLTSGHLSAPRVRGISSFAFNGLDRGGARTASGDQHMPEAVTMRVMSFNYDRRRRRCGSLSRLPGAVVAPELSAKAHRDGSKRDVKPSR